MIGSIPVSFPVHFIVLLVVGNEISQGESIMGSNKVDDMERHATVPQV
jgi:hypothetical protein